MNIKPGDLIKAYHKGYGRVLEVFEIPNGPKQVKYKQEFTDEAEPSKRTLIRSCDIAWVKLASEEIPKRVEELKQLMIRLENIL